MSQTIDNFKYGRTELLILHLLHKEDYYGYQLAHMIKEKSDRIYTVLNGSLYPVLYRLADSGYISEYTVTVGKRQTRKYYHLEELGRQYYKEILADYIETTEEFNKILGRKL